jgi:hypothetical protein
MARFSVLVRVRGVRGKLVVIGLVCERATVMTASWTVCSNTIMQLCVPQLNWPGEQCEGQA